MAIALASFLSLAPSSEGAVVISITGAPTDTEATFEFTGSLSSPDFLLPGFSPNQGYTVSDPTQPPNGGPLGSKLALGSPLTSPWSPAAVGLRFTDPTFSGDAQIYVNSSREGFSFFAIHEMLVNNTVGLPTFALRNLGSDQSPSVAPNDVYHFSGGFVSDLGGLTFAEAFIPGTHVGDYGSQSVNLIVTELLVDPPMGSIPEPSNSLVLGFCFLGMMSLRRR